MTVGNPLLDMISTVDEEFLRKYDIVVNTSAIVEERHMALFREMVDDWEVRGTRCGGGGGAIVGGRFQS